MSLCPSTIGNALYTCQLADRNHYDLHARRLTVNDRPVLVRWSDVEQDQPGQGKAA